MCACLFGCQIQRENDQWYSAEYSTFSVSDEVGLYTLSVGGYSGDAGDALAGTINPLWDANNKPFSTPDRDNDDCPACSCAALRYHGWWFGYCTYSSLNYDFMLSIWETVNHVYEVTTSRMFVKLY